MTSLCIGYMLNLSVTKQCTLLYQTTDYISSTNLVISSEVSARLRYDFHLSRIEKKLCNEVHALPNLATNGIASQSSWDVAFLAIDGDPAAVWEAGSCAHTGDGDNEWWLLDMQQVVDVEIVRLSNRLTFHERMSNFEIRIGMDSTNFSKNALCYNMSEKAPSGETINFPCLSVSRGRYVSIQRYFPYDNSGKFLHICEVQIIPRIPDKSQFNIAPYGKATQSSTLDSPGHGQASKAVDGFAIPNYHAGYSCTHTDTHANQGWWMLDMKQTRTVTLVRLTNRIEAYDRLFNFEIRVGFDGTDFSQNSLCYYMPGIVGMGAIEDFPCVIPIPGRYLTIQRLIPLGPSGNSVLTLCEVQVFQIGC